MLENEYLEMCNQLKEEFDKKDKELQELQKKYNEILKSFLSCYGFIRILDNADEEDKNGLIEILRGYCSQRLEEYFNIE